MREKLLNKQNNGYLKLSKVIVSEEYSQFVDP